MYSYYTFRQTRKYKQSRCFLASRNQSFAAAAIAADAVDKDAEPSCIASCPHLPTKLKICFIELHASSVKLHQS